MSITRRNFVRIGAAATLVSTLPRTPLVGQALRRRSSTINDRVAEPTDFAQMKSLALRAVDAARAEGATYADVRISRIISQGMSMTGGPRGTVDDREEYGFGIRALINGYWGFASSPYWEDTECTALARSAVGQAKANAGITPRDVEWVSVPGVTGEWTSRGVDPFTISLEEKIDFVNGWELFKYDMYHKQFYLGNTIGNLQFDREDWVFASTEGTVVSQTLYSTEGYYGVLLRHRDQELAQENGEGVAHALHVHRQRGGWEVILNANYIDQVPDLIERAVQSMGTSSGPSELGKYDIVFDAKSTSRLVAQTFGVATQLDRALGYEANAGGTSYLGPNPQAFLGGRMIASPLINLEGNRSLPWGLSTVKWDHEGTPPADFQIIKEGVLVDYQTTREQASWIKDWYVKHQRPVQSHGCSWSPSAGDIPIQHMPNLVMTPGRTNDTFDSLVAGTKRGVAVFNARPILDHQARNGIISSASMRAIVNGKLEHKIDGMGLLFNSTEMWNNVTGIGGAGSEQPSDETSTKGEPRQNCRFSVSAVPMAVKNVTVVDVKRRA